METISEPEPSPITTPELPPQLPAAAVSMQKLSGFIGDVLTQLASLQEIASAQITEIETLQSKISSLESRTTELEAFQQHLRLRLRQSRENVI